MKFLETIKSSAKIFGVSVSKHSPEILVGVGITAFIAAGVLTAKQTIKAADILYDYKEDPEADGAKKTVALGIIKTYALPVGLGVVGTTSILCGFGILKKRYVAVTAAYTSLKEAYDIYRKRISDKYGEEADRYGLYGVTDEEEIIKNPETGKKEKVTKPVYSGEGFGSPFAKLFAPYDVEHGTGSKYYERGDVMYNESMLDITERGFVSRYENGEPIFLNEVYKSLGFDILTNNDAGQRMGWWKGHEPEGSDGYFSLRITKVFNKPDPGYGEEEENVVWIIDPNVPGVIV